MPADEALSQVPTAAHGDGVSPYPCSTRSTPPGSNWSINYGYCRTSLDWHGPGNPQGAGDPRCPLGCQHKAPQSVAIEYGQRSESDGVAASAAWVRSLLPAPATLPD